MKVSNTLTEHLSIVARTSHRFPAVHQHRVGPETKAPRSESPDRSPLDAGTDGPSSDPHLAKPETAATSAAVCPEGK